ncbi:hypothetical protein DAEQUDRAFT_90554 [Daedalea quercina L-15889]|uniref:Uncharacterized protein n=1 Tax=Daedalea quercina L-15889 TaxID=1314783 RepID=A0A165S7S7_9APHY|nr:hypothetical protein DAEQUDRAFT_90554 [Daedalea quercina L-15889]
MWRLSANIKPTGKTVPLDCSDCSKQAIVDQAQAKGPASQVRPGHWFRHRDKGCRGHSGLATTSITTREGENCLPRALSRLSRQTSPSMIVRRLGRSRQKSQNQYRVSRTRPSCPEHPPGWV